MQTRMGADLQISKLQKYNIYKKLIYQIKLEFGLKDI